MTYTSPGIYTKETDFSYYVKHISTAGLAMVGVAERGPINSPTLVTSWEQFLNRYGGYIAHGYLAYAARAFFDNGGNVLYVNRVAHLSNPTDRHSLAALTSKAQILDRTGHALLTTGTPGTDSLVWTAIASGVAGNHLQIAIEATGTDTPLSVSVNADLITVGLATDGSGNLTSTVLEVIHAIEQDPDAGLLVRVTSSDSGMVQPAVAANLAGGGPGQPALNITAIDPGAWGDQIEIRITDSGKPGQFDLEVLHQGRLVDRYLNLSINEASPDHVELRINERSSWIMVEDLNDQTANLPGTGTFVLAGGDDGLTDLGDHDFIGDPSQKTGIFAFDAIDAVNMLAIPGITTAPVIHAGIGYAELRRDLFFLVDPPILLEPLEAIDFRKGTGMYGHAAFNSSYAGLYYPWLEISDPLTGKKKLVPPSGSVAGCFARNDQKAHVWSAPAGVDRGRVFHATGVSRKVSRGEMDVLYPEGINCIAAFSDSGLNIWGQRTLLSSSSALDRINARRLMMYMEESIGESSRFVVFQPNNPQTWRALIRLITPFLREIRDKGGLYAFRIQCDEETNPPAVIDRNEMVARVFVQTTKTAEFIELNFVLTNTGADFQEILNVI